MKLSIKEIALYAMLGTIMYVSKIVMDVLPNIHLIGMFVMAYTLVFRKKALYPIYVFVFLTGLFGGFATWWVPYLYIWTVLWGVTMLLPRNIPLKLRPIVYMAVCALHGFLYGVLYAPVQALLFGLSFKGMIAWIVAGIPFDITHGISNFFCGILILPCVSALRLGQKATKTS